MTPVQRLGVGLLLAAGVAGVALWPRRRVSEESEDDEGVPETPLLPPIPTAVPDVLATPLRAVTAVIVPTPVASANPCAGFPPLMKSQNGWPAHPDHDVVQLVRTTIPLQSGKSLVLLLRREVAGRLAEMVQWFDANIEPVNPADTGSFSCRYVRSSASTLSNHSSGTAIDINGSRHKLGDRGTIPAGKVAALVAKAKSLGLTWGGFWKRADEMHLEVSEKPSTSAVAASEAAWRAAAARRMVA